jgi:hypothetical protein
MACTDRGNRELMMKSKKAALTAETPVEKLRHACLARGANGIQGLARCVLIISTITLGVITTIGIEKITILLCLYFLHRHFYYKAVSGLDAVFLNNIKLSTLLYTAYKSIC